MIVGIDLGTTNSAIACWKDGEPALIPNAQGDVLTPSAVSFTENGELLVGLAARERQSTDPDRTATVFKRYMGTDRRITLGKKRYRPEELSSLVLASLKADAEAYLGEEVSEAVITVPAYFNDKQRRATRVAGELAGLTVKRLINEPTAAALSFGIHERELEEPFLVFDLGGGTFDVSLVEMFDGIIEVRASAGDNQLGGEDFNEVLVALMRKSFDLGEDPDQPDEALSKLLREAAERARRALTNANEVEMRVVWNGAEHTRALREADFAEAAEPLIQRLRDPVLRSLRDSSLRASELAEIVLVGGSTRMPLVRKTVTKMFGRFPNATIDPDHAIALGAAVRAGFLERQADLSEVRLTDVCPFSLGVGVAEYDHRGGMRDGIFSPIIERNTVIPASRVETYSTMQDNQEKIRLEIYQGEARDVVDNVRIGQLEVPVPKGRAHEVAVDVRFTYDTSGLLEVDANVPGTDIARQALIYDKSDDELTTNLESRRKQLAKLKVPPRDQAANAAALARAKRCYEGQLGPMRDQVSQIIGAFETVLASQEERQIDEARERLIEQLDQIEGENYL